MPSYENRYISNLTRETYALILAGGRGSRLHELTNWRAKPAVYFGGKHRIIDFPLSNCINSIDVFTKTPQNHSKYYYDYYHIIIILIHHHHNC